MVLLMDRFGYAKTIDVSAYERNREAADSENKYVISCMNTDKLCIFTDKGLLHTVKILELPYGKFRDKGTPLDNVSKYNSNEENIIYINCMDGLRGKKLLFVNSQGMIKTVEGDEFDVSKRTTAATKLSDAETVLAVDLLAETEEETIVMQTEKNMFLRFPAADVPQKKKSAIGVRGMKIDSRDNLKAAFLLGKEEKVIEEKDKQILLHRLRITCRDGKGVRK